MKQMKFVKFVNFIIWLGLIMEYQKMVQTY